MRAGANLVHWDGHQDNGALVEAGLFLVAVEALGRMETKPVVVVR
jgi:hypothetical protein